MFDVQNEFERARDFLRVEYELDLSLADLVRLKNDYIKPAVERINSSIDENTSSVCGPDIESATRFMSRLLWGSCF